MRHIASQVRPILRRPSLPDDEISFRRTVFYLNERMAHARRGVFGGAITAGPISFRKSRRGSWRDKSVS